MKKQFLTSLICIILINSIFAQNIPEQRSGHSFTTDDSYLTTHAYIFGGETAQGELSNELWLLETNEQHELCFTKINATGGPSARQGHSAWIADGKLYIYGGKDEYGNCLDDVWMFDFVSQTWQQSDMLALCIEFPAVVNDGSNTYFFGGANYEGESLSNFGYYDLNNPSAAFVNLESGIEPLQGSEAFVADNTVYVFGGYWHDWDASTPGNQPSFSAGIWTYILGVKTNWDYYTTTGDIAELASMACVIDSDDNFVYVLGGKSYDYELNSEFISDAVYKLNISTGNWEKLSTILPEPAHSLKAVYCDANSPESDKIILFGGVKEDDSKVQNVYVFDTENNSIVAVNPTSTKIVKKSDLNVYPNPVSDVLNYETMSDEIVENISIYSLDGKCVYTISNPEMNAVNVQSLMQGTYTLQICTNKISYTERFTIIR